MYPFKTVNLGGVYIFINPIIFDAYWQFQMNE